MPAIELQKSIQGQLRPSRVNFFYFFPLQKQQEDVQEVQDPENPSNFTHGDSKFDRDQDKDRIIPTRSQQNSWGSPTNIDTNSEYNSFLSFSIEFPKIRKRYLEDYLFLSNLGRGAYGRVQKLKSKVSNQLYAGKTLLKTPNSATNKYKNKKLQDQIKIYQKLNHPNIPQLHQIYTWKNEYTLILELAQGHNLHALLKDHPTDEQKIAQIMYQIFDTLEYLHALNIVHHDIKPENIIFDPNSQIIRIFDFGEAIQLNSPSETLLDQGGTFAYFAPEIFKNISSGKLDIWASGVILFYLLSGVIYFYGNGKDDMKKKILEKPVVFEGNYWNSRSENVKDLILKLLQKDYTKRISAKDAKNHPWIVQNTKNWQNPQKNVVRAILKTIKRSCSIDKDVRARSGRKINCDFPSLNRCASQKKVSRFCQTLSKA